MRIASIPTWITAIAAACAFAQAAEVKVTIEPYGGWERNARISNGSVEAVVTLDVGPRIIRYGFVGQANALWENAPDLGGRGEEGFRVRGGHRLWHAPELPERTYYPDNHPVAYRELPNGVVATAPVEQPNAVQCELEVTMDAETGGLTVVHRVTNRGIWPVQLASWGLTAMPPGGLEIIPLPPKRPHPDALLPQAPLVMWPYTDMSDDRWTWGRDYIQLRQNPAKGPNKIGLTLTEGWAAYLKDGLLFLKSVPYEPGAVYPDMNCNYETFTNEAMLEMETLSPLTTLDLEQTREHTERWRLYDDLPAIGDEADIARHIAPLGTALREAR